MKLLQWNVWYREDAKNILKTLREIDPDIICLQELTVNHPEYNQGVDVPNFLATELGFEYVFAPIFEEGERKFGNGIFSRFPILSSRAHFIQDPPALGVEADYSREGRGYLEVSIEVGGEPLEVGTTHMSYTHKFSITPEKKTETDKLLELLKEKSQRFIFSGDLNALPDSYTVTEISKLLTHCGPSFKEHSWATKHFSYNGFEASTLDWRLDYCFATPDIEVKSAQIIETPYSDHLPVLVEVKIPV